MRLINTQTFELKDFTYETAPPYAILSHTWGDDSEELTLRDVANGDIDKSGVGSIKLRGCCEQAQKDGLEYAWIDTCCIDKTNLVELSEAINSMFRWYSCASVCYAYLSDVPEGENPSERGSKFRTSRWFRRGWTLQELLAPKHLRFFDTEWQFIGTKGTISNVIKDITRVPRQFLLGIAGLHVASVAQRMSWAAQRETKRPEDLAYCLLGIFGIAMPMIYGEGGEQAFIRLQEQIMKSTRGDSILAWGLSDGTNDSLISDGDMKGSIRRNTAKSASVLATSPKHFENSGQIVCREQTHGPLQSLDVFGGSIRISLPLLADGVSGETLGLLSCGPASSPHQVVGLPLVRTTSVASNEYIKRWRSPVLRAVATGDLLPELIHIRNNYQESIREREQHWLYEHDLFARINLALVDVEPSGTWDRRRNLISWADNRFKSREAIFLRLRHNGAKSQDFVTILEAKHSDSKADSSKANASEADAQLSVMCSTVTCDRNMPLPEIAQSFPGLLSKASGEKSIGNEVMQLRVRLEPVEGGILAITPDAVDIGPDATVKSSGDADLVLEFRQILRERNQIYPKSEDLKVKSKYFGKRLQGAKQERIEVERQLRELEAKKKGLVEEEKICAGEMYYVGEEQAKIEERQGCLSSRLARADARLGELTVYDNNNRLGRTIFQDALENGDSEVVKSLYYKVDDMAAVNDGWIPLITASIRGDVDTVQELLSTRGVQADDTDTQFGRTALSWASGNGHEAIVKLLLNTDGIDVNSRGHNGWTPLKWAIEKDHKQIVWLLRGKGATLDGPLRVHRGVIKAMAFSDDSKLVVSGANDDTIKIWDTSTGRCQQTLQGYGERDPSSVMFSHDSRLVVSASADYSIRVWNRATGRCQKILKGHMGPVVSVAFSYDSKLIVSGSKDKTIRIWESVTGICQKSLQDTTEHYSVAISHDSIQVATGSRSGTVKIWDITTGKCLQIFLGHERPVSSVAFSPNSDQVVSCDDNGIIKMWETTGQCQWTQQGVSDEVNLVAFSPDSKVVVTASAKASSVTIQKNETGGFQRTIKGPKYIASSIAISQDLRFVASAPTDSVKRHRRGERYYKSKTGEIEVWEKTVIGSAANSLRDYRGRKRRPSWE